MTDAVDQPHRLAELHARAFASPWDSSAFRVLLGQPGVFAVETADGFVLMRVVADEAEILTLAVRPEARRGGIGRQLIADGCAGVAAHGAERVFLEVAEDNAAARALYERAGFVEAGRRPRYYDRSDGPRVDALLLVLKFSDALP